jgi:hypothetical protein
MNDSAPKSQAPYMRRFLVLTAMLALSLVGAFPVFPGEVPDQIVLYRWKGGEEKEIRKDFSPGEKIYADFTFLLQGEQASVEFRWINPLNKKEQVYSELVRPLTPPNKQTIRCWLYLPTSMSDRLLGSKYFGRWLLEVWVNSSRTATKTFNVGN